MLPGREAVLKKPDAGIPLKPQAPGPSHRPLISNPEGRQ